MNTLLLSLANLLTLLASFLGVNQMTTVIVSPLTTTLSIGETQLIVEIADTDVTREHGLSDRLTLPENAGMLFIFNTDDYHHFWMKDMNFPLDLIWIDNNWKIVATTPDITPNSYPQTFYPPMPVKYVLEVNAGFTTRHSIKTGEQIVLK